MNEACPHRLLGNVWKVRGGGRDELGGAVMGGRCGLRKEACNFGRTGSLGLSPGLKQDSRSLRCHLSLG